MKKRQNKSGKKFIRSLALAGICAMLLPISVAAAPGYDQVASSTNVKQVGTYGMTPIYGSSIADGTYEVEVECSSSFFKVLSAQLTVKDGQMTAVLNMNSNSYLYVYPGTGEEAAGAAFEEYIPLVKGDAESTFTIPVEALNAQLDLAAFSKKKEKWYDRKILINAADLPKEALSFDLPDYDVIADAITLYDETNGTDTLGTTEEETTEDTSEQGMTEPVTVEQTDGNYSIEVALAGGSGRASVTSPTWLYVKDGQAYTKLLWSSAYYDYMMVDGERYENETTDGSNSTFTIPITALDEPMTVIADTTAMGDPLEIEYTLTFYKDSIGGVGQIPQEAAKKVLVIALAIIIFGGILNYVVKKRRYR